MENVSHYDIIIAGHGPAGISAAIYAVRAGMKTAVIGSGKTALERARVIENYFGTADVSGEELQRLGVEKLKKLGGNLIDAQVTGISDAVDGFVVSTDRGDFFCRAVVLAVGKARKSPTLEGCEAFEGRGVSHCAICDGFFFRNKKVGVLGSGSYAAAEARTLLSVTSDVTIFTNGDAFSGGEAPCAVNTEPLSEVFGDTKLSALLLKNGERAELDGLFIAQGVANALDFAQKIGIAAENGDITIDKNGMTSHKGIFAAGDCVGGLNQLSTAVGEGALAGQRAYEYVRAL